MVYLLLPLHESLHPPEQEPWHPPVQLLHPPPQPSLQVPVQPEQPLQSQPVYPPEGCAETSIRSALSGEPLASCARRAASISCELSVRLPASILRLAAVSKKAAPPSRIALRRNCLRSANSIF